MKEFSVIYEAKVTVLVTAETEKQAKIVARAQLDPDVDWDFADIEEIS